MLPNKEKGSESLYGPHSETAVLEKWARMGHDARGEVVQKMKNSNFAQLEYSLSPLGQRLYDLQLAHVVMEAEDPQ